MQVEQIEAILETRQRIGRLAIVGALLAGLATAAWFGLTYETPRQLLNAGRRALARGEFSKADNYAKRLLEADPASASALLLAADAATARGNPLSAIEFLKQIPDDGSAESVRAHFAAGELLLLELKQLSPAEQEYRRVLAHDPRHQHANDRLAYILGIEGRAFELVPYQLATIKLGDSLARRLYMLALGELLKTDVPLVREFHEAAPSDPGPLTALAHSAMLDHDYETAKTLLQGALDADRTYLQAHVRWGQLLLSSDMLAELPNWHAALPKHADEIPAIWTIRGEWAARQGQSRAAIRCFWEAVLRDPNQQQANYQLGQQLTAIGKDEQAARFLTRAKALQDFQNAAFVHQARIDKSRLQPDALQKTSQQAEELGLLHEALGWARLTLSSESSNPWAVDAVPRLLRETRDLPLTRAIASQNPAAQLDFSMFPLPEFSSITSPELLSAAPNSGIGPADIHFTNDASSAGIEFRYFNSARPGIVGLQRVYEFTGGGVAVLDYNLDGWPDLHFTQGCQMPFDPLSVEHLDRLFRNQGDGTFHDVTTASGFFDNAYSQGAAVGDFDNDGFPDVLIGNLGANRLLANNGDGTFSDITLQAGIAGERWTTSCVIANLNGDSLPDIYVVNYLSGADLLTRVCRDEHGPRQSCLPQNFAAAQDQLYLNSGDGTFRDVTDTAGIRRPDGKGLGVVAGDFEESGRMSLFIANDAVPNFLFVNENAPGQPELKFEERALTAGLALSEEGRAQACMGIAAGDANQDGRIDLFVTNFTEEPNTLYAQLPGTVFRDTTKQAHLYNDSTHLLGFGTQFLDADLDGNPDLLVSNGHVDDYRSVGIPYEMPPQFFRNLGNGQFQQTINKSLGGYFTGKYLGRSLARIDWNRDGRDDAVVSHLDAPAALLTNSTKNSGNCLVLHLHGVQSSRDAIGAIVTVRTGRDVRVLHLMAGDGYQASNQRQLTFGLGKHENVDSLTIRWPNSPLQEIRDLPANSEWTILEGMAPVSGFRQKP